MEKLDLKKKLRPFYSAKKKPELVEIPHGNFLTIIGKGEPGARSTFMFLTHYQISDSLVREIFGLELNSPIGHKVQQIEQK
ncbi:MAG: hypothetical protein QGG23_00980 [Candidatus Bathyarchaeota archaeon]|jgi:hypothetical protein|nr:hypothetical protein [Candidatus Bathyarchaeota archaeon]MDP7443155.1 hypothetical protein [Candidatus Bathyarchaeota archaeon]